MTSSSPSASSSSALPTQNPSPGPWAAPWGVGGTWQVVPRAPSTAPALFLFAGQVVGLYSRFDVIVSTLGVCMPRFQSGPLHALVGHSYLSVPMQTHPTCSVMHALLAQWGARTPWGAEWGSHLPQHLAAQKTYNNLDISVREALQQRSICLEGVLTCYPHEPMEDIIDRIAKEQVSGWGALCQRQPLLPAAQPACDALPAPTGPSPGSGGREPVPAGHHLPL